MADDQGYVNRGPDARIFGTVGGWIQGKLSYRSPTPPKRWMTRNKNLALFWPPFLSIAIPRKGGRFFTFRAGLRWDEFWGDKTPCGTCEFCLALKPWACLQPIINPRPWGGYIADIIVKLNLDKRVGHD